MEKTVPREDFLRLLECVRPAVTPKDISEQSSCVAFKGGFLHAYSEDVYCRVKTPFPEEWEGAVPFPPLYTILSKLSESEVSVVLTKNEISIKGKGRQTDIRAEAQITMPFDGVTLPKKEDWKKTSPHFADALSLVESCAGKDADDFGLTCIHITPKFVEAADKISQMARHYVKTGLESPVLIRRDSLAPVAAMAPIKIAVAGNWLHMRTAAGSLYSARLNEGGYVNLDKAFEIKGQKVSLPKGLKEASDKAEVFSSEDKDNNLVMVTLVPGKVRLKGTGDSGQHREWKKIQYTGPSMSFMVSPKLLREILDRNNEVHIQSDRMIVGSDKWVYASILVRNEEKGEE